jgi:hypothetical protein
MSQTFTLPPGCKGFTTAEGTTLRSNGNGTITLEDHHANRLLHSAHASIGLISQQVHSLGTKTGKWCRACRFLAQGWAEVCPKCAGPVVPESELSATG